MSLTLALVAAAVTVGSMHTIAPDHWVPFAAIARAERWSARRTALITMLCGFGHVTVSVALGLVSVLAPVLGQRYVRAPGVLADASEKTGGIEYYLIEQEGSTYTPMETAERCLAAWKKLHKG